MGKMIVNGREYLINTELAPHVLDSVIEGILKYYPHDAVIEFENI